MNRKTIALVAGLVLIPIGAILYAQIPTPVLPKVEWDPVTQDVLGNPDAIVQSEVAVAEVAEDLNAGGIPINVIAGTATEADLTTLVTGQPQGSYNIWVRGYDSSGNPSAWGGPMAWNNIAPEQPTNIRIVVEISVVVP